MRDEAKMSELSFDAPLAAFDADEWNDFNDFQTALELSDSNGDVKPNERRCEEMDDNFDETFSGSLEDLVSTFDEKITKCFRNYEEKAETIAPVQLRTQEEIMNDCQMWWTITGNFGNILPIDWSKSYARELQTKSLKLGQRQDADSQNLDLSDDEELQQAFDMHSIIISSLHQEPLFTADEVINEIEGMMEDSPTPGSSPSDGLSASSTELLHFKEQSCLSPLDYEDSDYLKTLSVSALNELYEELECTIRDYSETLISELALRDELQYEKDIKNQFISLLLNIQKKRRELQLDKKRPIPRRPRSMAGAAEPGTYLTTVIPYHANFGPPSIEQLQIYIKILTAINEDSPSVPGLLTDYILKVLCPAT